MSKPIQLHLFCSEESFRSQFAARLLTFYGTAPKQEDSLSEDDVIDKLESGQHSEMPLKFIIDEFEFEIVWKNEIDAEKKRNNTTLFLLLLELKQVISQSMLQTLQKYEIQQNSFFVIVDKLSDNREDTEVQSYESDLLKVLDNLLVNEDRILTVVPDLSENNKVLICDKFKEVAKSIFEVSHIKAQSQNNKDELDDVLTKMCSQYGIQKIEEFIEQVKNGNLVLGCAMVKDRKARKTLMEALQSLSLLKQFILQKQNSPSEVKSKSKIENSSISAEKALTRICEKFEMAQNRIEKCVQEILSGDFDSAKLNIKNKSSRVDFIKQCKDCVDQIARLKNDKIKNQLKNKASQELIPVLSVYVIDPEECLSYILEDKIEEALKEVKKPEQQQFLFRINKCKSYQQYLTFFKKLNKGNNKTHFPLPMYFQKKDSNQKKLKTAQKKKGLFDESSEDEKIQISKKNNKVQKKNKIFGYSSEEENDILKNESKNTNEEESGKEIVRFETGTLFDENGNRYQGELKNGKRDGKGILFYTNGNKYAGKFKNGLREGKGIFYYQDGSRFEGMYKNDEAQGKGQFFYFKGDKYQGQFKNGLREGKGTYFSNDGNKYEGQWKNNLKQGQGIYYYANGSKYEGQWKNDKKQGKGIHLFANGDTNIGQFKNGLREGKGIRYNLDGNRFEGKYKNGKADGKGIYFFAFGSKYEGQWINGIQQGQGIETDANGKQIIGIQRYRERNQRIIF